MDPAFYREPGEHQEIVGGLRLPRLPLRHRPETGRHFGESLWLVMELQAKSPPVFGHSLGDLSHSRTLSRGKLRGLLQYHATRTPGHKIAHLSEAEFLPLVDETLKGDACALSQF